MAVNIEYALCEGTLTHISNRILKDKTYHCPACKESVIAKKGQRNAHHYAHAPDSSCTASQETMLHLFAKHVLTTEDVKLKFPITLFKNSIELVEIMDEYFDMEYLNIELYKLFDFLEAYEPLGKTEISIGKFIADVLFIDSEQGHKELIVEVFVTHAMEYEKIKYFNDVNLPYIEVKPIFINSSIEFFVTATNMHDFIDQIEKQLSNDLFSYTLSNQREKLLSNLKNNIVDREKIKLERNRSLELLYNDVDYINFRDYIDVKLYKKMNTIPAAAKNSLIRVERVETLKLNYGKKPFLICNGKYVFSETHILYSLINHFLQENIIVEALVDNNPYNNKECITGFNFRIPRNSITGDVMKDILKVMISKL